MSQTFFSKLDQEEKNNRLRAISNNRGLITLWLKGGKDKHFIEALKYDADRKILVLSTQDDLFPDKTSVLCSFEFRGMNFFAQGVFLKSVGDFACLQIEGDLFKSEKRSSYRLMTYPQHDVWAVFNLEEGYQGGKVINIQSRQSTTGLFRKFLHLVEGDESNPAAIRIRVQDLSTTGMALHVGELEADYFTKGSLFRNVHLRFVDDEVVIPELVVVYEAKIPSGDKNLVKFKVGIHFERLPNTLDHWLGKKINELLRESDHNKAFENFQK